MKAFLIIVLALTTTICFSTQPETPKCQQQGVCQGKGKMHQFGKKNGGKGMQKGNCQKCTKTS